MIAMSLPNDLIIKEKLEEAMTILSGIQQALGLEESEKMWKEDYPKVKRLAMDIYNSLVVEKDMLDDADPLSGYVFQQVTTNRYTKYVVQKKV